MTERMRKSQPKPKTGLDLLFQMVLCKSMGPGSAQHTSSGTFVGDRDSDTEWTLCKCVNDSKLCSAAAQKDLDGLEWWARANLMKFNEAKFRVLHMGWSNPRHEHRFGREWIENNPGDKDLGTRSLS
ncbi:hypothetical protein DUI87_16373 [Hirundo rustica rustica]|uniref:Rna-directed dna polymerase from mobile element jockey-like n=1 Tax=Hirundo rustica rustica TaxID=333673 RepID=A0A3M0K110_HIRRU|nr:hypothetical protein DUI87_16373 [Hirundo rustica rustica]